MVVEQHTAATVDGSGNVTGVSPVVDDHALETESAKSGSANVVHQRLDRSCNSPGKVSTKQPQYGLGAGLVPRGSRSGGSRREAHSTRRRQLARTGRFTSVQTTAFFTPLTPMVARSGDFRREHMSARRPPLLADGTVYVGSWDNYVYAINSDGSQKWRFQTGATSTVRLLSRGRDGLHRIIGQLSLSSIPTAARSGAFQTVQSTWLLLLEGMGRSTSIMENYVYAINSDGSQRWRFQTGGSVSGSPAIGRTARFSSDHGTLSLRINPNGSQNWRFQTGGRVFSSPAIGADGTICVGSDDSSVYAINPNGSQKWRFQTGLSSSRRPPSDRTERFTLDHGTTIFTP